MAILTKQQIKDVEDITQEEISVPEWGGEVVIRSISKRQMRDMKKRIRNKDGEVDEDELEKEIFLSGVVDPQFDREDYEWLLDKSMSAMNNVTQAILGASKEDEGAVKDAEKQFRS